MAVGEHGASGENAPELAVEESNIQYENVTIQCQRMEANTAKGKEFSTAHAILMNALKIMVIMCNKLFDFTSETSEQCKS